LKLIETNKSKQIGQINNQKHTALMYACQNRLSAVALKLLETGMSNPSQEDEYGNTALLFACKKNMKVITLKIIFQLEKMENIKINQQYLTSLFYTCYNKDSETALKIIEFISKKDKHFNMFKKMDKYRRNILMVACKNKMTNVVSSLYDIFLSNQNNPNDIEILKRKDKYGNNLLTYACNNKMYKIALDTLELTDNNNKLLKTLIMQNINNGSG